MNRKDLLLFKNYIDKLLKRRHLPHGLGMALRKLSKEIALHRNYLDGIKKWEKEKDNFNTTKIQIGGGSHTLIGFLNLDIVPPADILWDVREGLPFKDKCSKFVFSEHFLEHIDYPISVKKFIHECFRILKLNGQLVIGVPDSEIIVRGYFNKNQVIFKKIFNKWYSKRNFLKHVDTYIDLLNYHFRDQDDDKKYNSHLWAYDYEKLYSLLKNAGFSRIKKWDFDATIANPERKWGSLYVIATK